jgi:predicted RNA binding protein YcfA (HicA-like mRNA interferase family)
MQRDKRKVENALETKGFQRDERHHHYFLYRTQQGKLTAIRTRTSHSGKEIDARLLGRMAQQCQLSRNEFLALVDCTMSQADYESAIVDLLN